MMQITVQKKSLGRSRKLMPVRYELEAEPQTLRELLHALVALEIARYEKNETLLQFLIAHEEVAKSGQVKFSTMMPHEKQDVAKNIHVMELAFEDGLFKVLQGNYVYTSLDEAIYSQEPNWTFIKLTFIAGR